MQANPERQRRGVTIHAVADAPGSPRLFLHRGRPDDADLLDLLLEWAPDDATRRKILVDNPAALYDF